MSLKLALFAFLSALACTIANGFIDLMEVSYIADAFWLLSFICIVIWVCKYISKVKRVGGNLAVAFFSFATALYFGVYSSFTEDELLQPIAWLIFYAAAVFCLACVVLLIGRWIFGSSAPEQETVEAVELLETVEVTPQPVDENKETAAVWTCACGEAVTGNFCSNCGAAKPKAEVESEKVEE